MISWNSSWVICSTAHLLMTFTNETVVKKIFFISGLRNSELPFDKFYLHIVTSHFFFFIKNKTFGRKNQVLCSLILGCLEKQSAPDSATYGKPP